MAGRAVRGLRALCLGRRTGGRGRALRGAGRGAAERGRARFGTARPPGARSRSRSVVVTGPGAGACGGAESGGGGGGGGGVAASGTTVRAGATGSVQEPTAKNPAPMASAATATGSHGVRSTRRRTGGLGSARVNPAGGRLEERRTLRWSR